MKHPEVKRKEEEERLAYWRSLTPQQQLAQLDRRLGQGVGARRQRGKLVSQLGEGLHEK